MSEGTSSSADALVRTSERLPAAKKSVKFNFGEITIDHGDIQAVTQPPHQQALRSSDVTGKKQKSSRRSSQRSSLQGPVLTASHIEEAAGDDRCARCLLAVLFCEVSIVCSSVLGCISCGLCSDGALCGSLCPGGLTCARVWPCDPGCAILDEGCRSSDCLDICLECCSLCFPS
ncbi:myoD family inhibitor domain-containing protein-like isoform X2 [Bufo gargarizans]|uniref:myoD family inhibitor domain-containing protein-like isoform X2 n=1 Tax=Bufo gargarizans TaxID=30331 RepID=UPI001CF1D025|nr:myoD family inhibitor domain-containing protein-like isoform X2 [Bufo gargarizans]